MQAGRLALSARRCGHADLVIVDEVGKLEARHEGWAPQLKELLELDIPLHSGWFAGKACDKYSHLRIDDPR